MGGAAVTGVSCPPFGGRLKMLDTPIRAPNAGAGEPAQTGPNQGITEEKASGRVLAYQPS